MSHDAESKRLDEAQSNGVAWKKWGPYLSERQWGTVREDYSDSGDAWNYFTHDQARSRAYRWGEDGLGGISDDHQVLCFALALWNGRDPILKERAFGLANSEGNHGEDVKEYYFYLDSTPTHSYMKYLYKYPQAAYPYDDLVATNRGRGKHEPEYELLDTGVFDDNRYFDVFVEYAKAAPDDMLIRISVCNRGPGRGVAACAADALVPQHVVAGGRRLEARPRRRSRPPAMRRSTPRHTDPLFLESLADYFLYCDADVPLLFTENETNNARLFGAANASPYVKDGINNFVVHGDPTAVNPAQQGTKVAAHYQLNVGAGADAGHPAAADDARARHAGRALRGLRRGVRRAACRRPMRSTPRSRRRAVREDPDRANVMRQALAGMLWTKQYFYYDLDLWLDEHGAGSQLPRTSAGGCATASGPTCSTTTSSRCRTSGSTRGTPRGTWRST